MIILEIINKACKFVLWYIIQWVCGVFVALILLGSVIMACVFGRLDKLLAKMVGDMKGE